MTDPDLIGVIEGYYDTVPRASAAAEPIGPFTLFVQADSSCWPFYARPTLGGDAAITMDDVLRVRERQRALGVPESFEWVDEVVPGLLELARATGLEVAECPLLVLDPDAAQADSPSPGVQYRVVGADDAALGQVGAFRDGRAIGGGSHSLRAGVTELTGIGVLPSSRRRGVGAAITGALVADARAHGAETVFLSARDDEAARVYLAQGFRRMATACIAEPR